MKYLLLTLILTLLSYSLWTNPPQVLEDGKDYNTYFYPKRERPLDEWMSWAFGQEKYAAYKIMKCESGGNPRATNYNTNGTRDSGLFQINSVHAKKVNGDLDSLYDPHINIRVAKMIYDSSGFEPWVCKKVL